MNGMIKPAEKKALRLSIGDVTNIIIAIVAMVALIFSAYQYNQGLKLQAKIDRPILSCPKIAMGYDTTLLGHSIQINTMFENYGARPAFDVTLNSVTIEKLKSDGGFKVVSSISLQTVNPIVPGVQFGLGRQPMVYHDSTLYYFKVLFSYKDVVSKIYYSDSLYYGWKYESFPYSLLNSQLLALERRSADSIDNYLKKVNFRFH